MSLAALVSKVSCTAMAQLNTLSIPSNHVIGDAHNIWRWAEDTVSTWYMLTLCSIVVDNVKAQESATTGSTWEVSLNFLVLQHPELEAQCFYIISSVGTMHPVHFNANRFHMLLNVLSGFKLGLVVCPISDTEPTPPNLARGDTFIIMKSDQYIISHGSQTRSSPVSIPLYCSTRWLIQKCLSIMLPGSFHLIATVGWLVYHKVNPCGNAGVLLWFLLWHVLNAWQASPMCHMAQTMD